MEKTPTEKKYCPECSYVKPRSDGIASWLLVHGSRVKVVDFADI
jgi:hypothetical protein